MTTPPAITRLAVPALLALAAAFTLTACLPAESACAAVAVMGTPPEPIEDGTYRDGSHEENAEVPPEPVEDGSYRDGSEQQNEQSDAPPEPGEHQNEDNASNC
ncbi:hypothetical protein [Streptosporangium sp. NPDC002721]|uniref:hypothetical protein n=1 Tax=Streptosporangium sp. NPDC002721 TaxID=3366188 RepID=UPI00367E3524